MVIVSSLCFFFLNVCNGYARVRVDFWYLELISRRIKRAGWIAVPRGHRQNCVHPLSSHNNLGTDQTKGMPKHSRLEHALHPVTALAFLRLDRVCLLVGEGQYLRAFDHQTSNLLLNHCIFKSENIHGIACSNKEDAGLFRSVKLLLWGGYSICLVELSIQESATGAPLRLNLALPEVRIDDWILHASFKPFVVEPIERSIVPLEAVLVTAHNELRGLVVKEGALHIIKYVGSGPKSLLSSAHLSWSMEDHVKRRVLVAGGTVFGEVHLWSFQYDQSWDSTDSRPCRSFKGHLGSVFGVRLSEEVNLLNCSTTRLLASCSDDRTIRVWDISELDTADHVEASTRCLASTMAHASRIWSVQFLNGQTNSLKLLSFGEDGTAQSWLLKPTLEAETPEKMYVKESLELVRLAKYHYHSGKHIWAAAVLEDGDNSNLIATGGGDGRIVSYVTDLPESTAANRTASCQANMGQVETTSATADGLIEAATKNKVVFNSLEGHCRLSRRL